jgi:FSR family fosmidomycin resistance protein-like MFS transporter
MRAGISRRRPAPVAVAVLAALAVEFVDELVDGTKSAAMPLIRDSLGLSYGQVGLLAAVPLIAGSLVELPMGVLAGQGRRRRRVVAIGGLLFILALLAAASARTFGGLLAAFVIFFPASGAFVSLTEAALVDAAPGRTEQLLARWTMAGAVGAVAGPLLLALVVSAGGGWQTAYLVLAVGAGLAWLGLVAAGRDRLAASPTAGERPDRPDAPDDETDGLDGDAAAWPARLREAAGVLRDGSVLRWLVLLQLADLLLDVFTGFVALYLVAATEVSAARAALGIGVRLAADLAGSAALIPVLERVRGRAVLRASAVGAAALYPAFLLVPGFWPKVCLLAGLSFVTSAWYPVLQAELYRSLPGRSGTVVSLLSAAGLVGGLGPLAVGFAAGQFGLGPALALLVVVPVSILVVTTRAGRRPRPARNTTDSPTGR